MTKLRAGLPFIFSIALMNAMAECRAASTTYKLTDLGVNTAGLSVVNPLAGYSAPQVDDSGAIHYGTGTTDAGPYHFASERSDITQNEVAEYSKSGTAPIGIYIPKVSRPSNYGSLISEQSYAGGVNATGTAVGYITPGPDAFSETFRHTAFVYNPSGGPLGATGQLPGFSLIPGAYSGTSAWYALGVNVAGQIVGVTAPPGDPDYRNGDFGAGRAMLSDGKTSIDLNTLIAPGSGWLLTSATSINDLGQIAGYGFTANGSEHAYLLTPTTTPEPGAWAVALAVAGYLGLRRAALRRGK